MWQQQQPWRPDGNDKVFPMSKYFGAITSLLLWAAGTGLVLVTLSGDTLSKAMYISVAALLVNVIAIALGVGIDE